MLFAEGVAASLGAVDGIVVDAIAATAADGERVIASHQPDVALIDYGLPDCNGIELAARLHARRPELRIVIVTSLVYERLVVRAVEAGCSGFITKDQSVDELVAAIRAAAEGEALISPTLLSGVLRQIRGRSGDRRGDDLSTREREVLTLVCEGLSNPAIAARLHVSHNTVRSHVQSILSKLQVHSKLEAAAVATRNGIVELT